MVDKPIPASEILTRWNALFPYSSNPPGVTEVPSIKPEIIPVIVLNTPTTFPFGVSNSAAGATKQVYTVPAGFRLIVTFITYYNGVAADTIWYDGVGTTTTIFIPSFAIGMTPYTLANISYPIYNGLYVTLSAAQTTTWMICGYLERITP